MEINKLQRKYKKLLRGCGEECEKGGTCWHLSRDKKLLFHKDLTDSKFERVRMYCNNCRIELLEIRAKLRLLKEIVTEIDKSKAFSSHTKMKFLNKFFNGRINLLD